MNTTPTATAPNKYRNDLAAGACYGQLDFTEQPLAEQYVACLGCPVRDLCPVPTPWPRGECCKRGHVAERYANGTCKACRWLHALLVAAGMLSLAEDLAEYRESRRRKPGLRPPGRPRKVREVAP